MAPALCWRCASCNYSERLAPLGLPHTLSRAEIAEDAEKTVELHEPTVRVEIEESKIRKGSC